LEPKAFAFWHLLQLLAHFYSFFSPQVLNLLDQTNQASYHLHFAGVSTSTLLFRQVFHLLSRQVFQQLSGQVFRHFFKVRAFLA